MRLVILRTARLAVLPGAHRRLTATCLLEEARRSQTKDRLTKAAGDAAWDMFEDLKQIIAGGFEYPEDLLEHALRLYPATLVRAIGEIQVKKRKPIPVAVRRAVEQRDKGH